MATRINRGYRKRTAIQSVDRKHGLTKRVRKILNDSFSEDTIIQPNIKALERTEYIRTLASTLAK